MFKNHLTTLNVCILLLFCSFLIVSQGPTVQGKVSLTCDTWQVGNTDGYFAVTAHWIEELTPGKWELNNAHNGERLGQALFKIVRHVRIEDKVRVSLLSYSHHAYPLP
ncbi:hypothetical protein L208DRAFT_1295190 [Tricholoma matsutake]|nr:hypothetical protein L208DRAFT_1295190 [Tricholoma matsutake 945]